MAQTSDANLAGYTALRQKVAELERKVAALEQTISDLTNRVPVATIAGDLAGKVNRMAEEADANTRRFTELEGELRPRVRLPKPKSYGGARDAREVENFLWDIEAYFDAAQVCEGDKVVIAPMYLASDAKLWWRNRLREVEEAKRGRIETWEVLKAELKTQFLPEYNFWAVRDAMRSLKQTGTVRDYVNQFCSLALQVKDMSHGEKLFDFTFGLSSWAQAELARRNVKDLQTAIAEAERLRDDSEVVGIGKVACYICGGSHKWRRCAFKSAIQIAAAELRRDEASKYETEAPDEDHGGIY